MGFNYLKVRSPCKETVYFLPLNPLEFLVLILSTSEGWKAELTLEPPSGFELETLDSSNFTKKWILLQVLFQIFCNL